MFNRPKILIIYTGGTIGMIKDYETGALKAFDFSEISKNIPELKHLKCEITTVSFEKPIDSSNMDIGYYVSIAELISTNYESFEGFVVLSGSDTMAYTSSVISFMFENLQKPVIFTGSQLPIGDLRTDAKENLITTIEVASARLDNKPIISEVCLYFEYKLYRANRTTKINSEHFEAFKSMNYPPLMESGVHLNFNFQFLHKTPITHEKLIYRNKLDSNVVVLKLFPGITSSVVESILHIPELKGVILETYGAGNAPTTSWFISLLSEAVNRGIHVVNVTQCKVGTVIMGHYETSSQLEKIGVISGKDITTESALAKMMYLLGIAIPHNEFKHYYELPLRGEMTL